MPLTTSELTWFFEWMQLPTWKLAGLLFVNGLWMPLFYVYLMEVWEAYNFWISGIFYKINKRYIFLAIDVPRSSELGPASMEAIFNQLAGAHGTQNWWEQHWVGDYSDAFSFEIVSLDGYVQYIVRCAYNFRDLVEASIYAQYPDAEISEVTDYTKDVPSTWPNDTHNMMATEYLLAKPSAFPIKTYNQFEDKIRGELIDPMGGLLEIMSKINKGEQIWYQILARPIIDPDWVPSANKEINKIIERKNPPGKPSLISRPLFYINDLISSILGIKPASSDADNSDAIAQSPMFKLTPGERVVLEDMERKTDKLAYKCLIRIVYIAENSVFEPKRGFSPVLGAMKQFNEGSKNWFTVSKRTWTKTAYAFKNARKWQRQTAMHEAYSARSMYAAEGCGGYVLNSEELATIYHFPLLTVKAPLVKRTGAKKSEPPATLPMEGIEGSSVINIPNRPEPPRRISPSESSLSVNVGATSGASVSTADAIQEKPDIVFGEDIVEAALIRPEPVWAKKSEAIEAENNLTPNVSVINDDKVRFIEIPEE